MSHNMCNCSLSISYHLYLFYPDFMELDMEEFTFTPGGSLTQTITVETLTDMIVEGDETLSLKINGITGPGQTGTPSSVTLTITDDDSKSTLYSYYHI